MKENEVILVEQYRKAIEQVTLEIPAGKLEPGEDNKKLSAIRELKEETGYEVTEDQLTKLFDVHVALGYSSEVIGGEMKMMATGVGKVIYKVFKEISA